VITLTLLHPVQGTAVQSWTFKDDQTVRIGRAVDNEVVLYSAVVSRYHVEVRYEENNWYVHNIGINGTFIEGKKIESEALEDGKTFRLARSGPNIQVSIQSTQDNKTFRQTQAAPNFSASPKSSPQGTGIESPPPLASNTVDSVDPPQRPLPKTSQDIACDHRRSPPSSLICIDCGEPMNVLSTIGPYKVLKKIGDRDITFQAWKNKKTYILRTAPTELLADSTFAQPYRDYLNRAAQLNYGGIPRVIEVLEFEDKPHLVYEMIYGMSLEKWVQDRGRLSLPLAISWITEVARALEYLHQLDPPFVHQGVKPRNIIRPTIPQGNHHLMLVNFGQIDAFSSMENQTESDLAYRSPQLAQGDSPIELDLYGLGATFLFMLTASDPYKYIQLGDNTYRLQVEESPHMPLKAWDLMGGLMKAQSFAPITTISEAIDRFLHLI
jgi:eukaryotic-like serine/threonine-protein kinase